MDTQAKDRKGGVTTKSSSSLGVIVAVDKESAFARSHFACGLQHFSLRITLIRHKSVEGIEQLNQYYVFQSPMMLEVRQK